MWSRDNVSVGDYCKIAAILRARGDRVTCHGWSKRRPHGIFSGRAAGGRGGWTDSVLPLCYPKGRRGTIGDGGG